MMPLKGLYLVVGLALLSGCGSSRPTSPPENLTCNLSNYQVHDVYDQILVYLQTPELQTPESNVLELSTGGEFGAYGSGYLAGWKSTGGNAKPIAREDIQIVTGVSTGALMATYAFLSTYDTTKNWDEELVKFYLGLKNAKIYSQRYLSLIWANSLFDTAGKTTLLQNIDSELVKRVRGAPPNRGLYVGIANLDSGEFVRIDMKKLAKGTFENEAQRVGCYRAVIDAATAVEVVFPPVFIDGHMMGDGGVRQHVFLVSPDQPLPNSDLSKPHFRSFTLVHGNLEVTPLPNGVVKNGVLDIAQRVASIFTDQSLKSSIRLSNALALHPAVVVGKENAKKLPRFEPFYGSAAKAACACSVSTDRECGTTSSHGADLFCPAFMDCLAKAGKYDGAEAALSDKWLKIEDLDLGSTPLCQLPAGHNFR